MPLIPTGRYSEPDRAYWAAQLPQPVNQNTNPNVSSEEGPPGPPSSPASDNGGLGGCSPSPEPERKRKEDDDDEKDGSSGDWGSSSAGGKKNKENSTKNGNKNGAKNGAKTPHGSNGNQTTGTKVNSMKNTPKSKVNSMKNTPKNSPKNSMKSPKTNTKGPNGVKATQHTPTKASSPKPVTKLNARAPIYIPQNGRFEQLVEREHLMRTKNWRFHEGKIPCGFSQRAKFFHGGYTCGAK